MRDQKGFTMVELMAVNAILVIVGLVVILIVLVVVEDLKKGAARDSALGIIKAGELMQAKEIKESIIGPGTERIYTEKSGLNYKGKKGNTFEVVMDKNGKSKFSGFIDGYCIVKDFDDTDVSINKKKKTKEACVERSYPLIHWIGSKNIEDNQEGLMTDDFGNIRYIGKDAKNYVTFNHESWRIIGVFHGKVKLMKTDVIENRVWDQKGKNGINQWSTSKLVTYLNGNYYDHIEEKSRNMIENATYYLGGASFVDATQKNIYEKERATKTVNCVVGEREETEKDCPRATTWYGKIALPYVSDYVYAGGKKCNVAFNQLHLGDCIQNNWMAQLKKDQWFLTPSLQGTSYVWGMRATGLLSDQYQVDQKYGVRPALYLKSTVQVVSGKGTKTSPYRLK